MLKAIVPFPHVTKEQPKEILDFERGQDRSEFVNADPNHVSFINA
jgi:hypothetical protein